MARVVACRLSRVDSCVLTPWYAGSTMKTTVPCVYGARPTSMELSVVH